MISEGIRQNFSYGFCRLLLGRCGDGGIGMQGEPRAEVPQHPGYRLDVYPVLEGQRCECMPQIVESNSGQPGSFQHPVEYMQDAIR